jgi:hypothetical protein
VPIEDEFGKMPTRVLQVLQSGRARQVRERGLHLVAGGLGQTVGAPAGGGIKARVRFTDGCFQAVHIIISVIVFEEQLQLGGLLLMAKGC